MPIHPAPVRAEPVNRSGWAARQDEKVPAPRGVILAGGYGTRMLPLTVRRPKHLLPIGDEPVIAAQLRLLARVGVEEVILATAYHADAFRPVLGDGSRYGVRLTYAREDTPLGTAGALRHALVTLDGPDFARSVRPVVVLNGDLVTDHDVAAQLAQHRESNAGVTLHVRHVDDARPFGLVTIVGDRATAFHEKPRERIGGFVNAGTYVLTPRVLAHVAAHAVSSLEREVFPPAAASGDVQAYREDAHFADIGSPAALLDANLRWAQARGRDAVVLSNRVDPTAHVHSSLVLAGAVVEAGACIENSVIAPGARVGTGARLRGCVLGDDAQVSPGHELTDVVLDVGEHR